MNYFLKSFLMYILLICCGCSSLGSNIAPGYSDAIKLAKNYIYGPPDNIDPEVIRNIPYASMKLRIGKGSTGLLILEQKIGKVEYWVSADEVYVVIKNGRVIQTSGLENNLIRTTSHENLFTEESSYSYLNSYDNPKLDSFKVNAYLESGKLIEVDLNSGNKTLLLLEESLKNDYTGWNVTNKYWIDSEGYVWKSIQHISPKLPPFYIEITKRPL